eukprot:NODE_893_length_1131_cov_102.442231_g851_i0.p1 GENE.NODE_893_length_1131_cov_102.442231_g851_i0~~NODE_893_length_1131_cov_102.442231_g851_i0.p1  ORF type:complete len:316 (+),score=18.64 NODE_893_length_1131_cov_102.442231_g851_i0:116-1063(+)
MATLASLLVLLIALVVALVTQVLPRYFYYASEFPVHLSGAVLVTNSGSDIGLETALALASLGYHVYAGVSTPAEIPRFTRYGLNTLIPIHLDVTNEKHVKRVVRQIVSTDGHQLVGLVATNSLEADLLPMEHTRLSTYASTMDVYYSGTVRVLHAALESLEKSQGRVVIVGSMSSSLNHVPYHTVVPPCQAALEGLAFSLRKELAPANISVSIVKPSFTKTATLASLAERLDHIDSSQLGVYKREFSVFRKAFKSQLLDENNTPPEIVVRMVVHALRSPNPRTQYVRSIDWYLSTLLSITPTHFTTKILRSVFNV